MNSSPNSSPTPVLPLPTDLSDRERCAIALFLQLQKFLGSLPASFAQLWAPLLDKLNAISVSDRNENAALHKALENYHAQVQGLQQVITTLTKQLWSLERKLEVLESEQDQREQLVRDIRNLSAEVLRLNSVLTELNGFAPP